MKNKHLDYDLSDAKSCRQFLKDLRFPNGAKIKFLKDVNGKDITIDDATDAQIIQTVRDSFGLKGHDQ